MMRILRDALERAAAGLLTVDIDLATQQIMAAAIGVSLALAAAANQLGARELLDRYRHLGYCIGTATTTRYLEFEMYSLPIAQIITNTVSNDEAHSALPDAPVVPHVDKVPVLARPRKAVASGLVSLADLIAPARPVRPARTHSGLRGEAL